MGKRLYSLYKAHIQQHKKKYGKDIDYITTNQYKQEHCIS